MTAPAFGFERPEGLQADSPPEARGLDRDAVRLMVTRGGTSHHSRFVDLAEQLCRGDLLVVNRSATLPASLPAHGEIGEFRIHLSTSYGKGLWLAEPRWAEGIPGPLPLRPGDSFRVAGLSSRVVAEYPGIRRLLYVDLDGDVADAMRRFGAPIRYAHAQPRTPLSDFQTIFGDTPGSAEMPSAGRPFSRRVVDRLRDSGIEIGSIVLHAGVSSLELGDTLGATPPVYPEPFEVSESAAAAIGAARRRGGRVIAVGTTVVRALESAFDGQTIRPARGFTRAYVTPERRVRLVDGLLTGFHDPNTTHLAILAAIAGVDSIRASYGEAVREHYLWHEFGDSHLLLRNRPGE